MHAHFYLLNRHMEEKKYPVIEKEDGYGVLSAAEPAVAFIH
jgi:hypothetical protein